VGERTRSLLSVSVYPVLMTASVTACLLSLGRGIDGTLIVVAINVAGAALMLLLERVLPYRKEWQTSKGDVRADLLHLVATSVSYEGGRALAAATVPILAIVISRSLGRGLWPDQAPLLAQLGLALVLAELPTYAFHRLQHRGGLFWRIHAVHHSAPRLYWLNSARNHPLDAGFAAALMVSPLLLLGAGPSVFTLYGVFSTIHSLFQHSNVDVRLGPLNWVLSSPEVHRWHHSRVLEEANANYGQNLLVWDLVFGTRRVPRDHAPPSDTGLTDMPDFPQGWFASLLTPFRGALFRPRAMQYRNGT
jgi:sterol desaturase/sphingolipid hydroxylase (fatty acid hydroxylase superfamily)